jgi:hypothetical protein
MALRLASKVVLFIASLRILCKRTKERKKKKKKKKTQKKKKFLFFLSTGFKVETLSTVTAQASNQSTAANLTTRISM